MRCERSQRQKTTCYVIPFIEKAQDRQIHRDRKCISNCGGLRGKHVRNDGSVIMGISLRVMEMFFNFFY